MAAAATSPYTSRYVFGNTEESAKPRGSPSCLQAVAESTLTWRVIFGNTSAWLPPQLDTPATPTGSALAEVCELCRQAIGQDETFITNSAGQRPAHTRCLSQESPAVAEQGSALTRWLSMLRDFLKS